ncbi:phosphatase PAP2 family protein [Halostella sp. JP-L12]|uniref:phosphatase PAP2 family protein n=1 Tax=Halostella sp. JP-L12 TaxID=2716716 RepID=UPI000EF7667B|nr:phosphatase PAP2 family protein [Halostella sp. JP-L12]NHN46967.1 phosphatase PAP2 family protein [Halostella sp. JP-L12]
MTTLGNYEVLIAIALAYGLVIRQFDVTPLALVVGAIALTTWLKATLAVPRPPGSAVTGYAMPSGHALVSTVCYGTLAVIEDRGLGPRTLVVGCLVAAIAVSRVVIGVHYVVDVVVGVTIGVVLIAAGVAAQRRLTAADVLPMAHNAEGSP